MKIEQQLRIIKRLRFLFCSSIIITGLYDNNTIITLFGLIQLIFVIV